MAADSRGMLRTLVLLMLVGCRPYMAAGYDTMSGGTGPLAQVSSDNQVARPAEGADVVAAPTAPGRNLAFAIGGGVKDFRIELGVQPRNVSGDSFSFSDSSKRFVTALASLDARWTPIRVSRFAGSLHVGPTGAVVVDKMQGLSYGQGIRFGATAAVSVAGLSLYADVYRCDVGFDAGPAAGMSSLTGMTVGLALGR